MYYLELGALRVAGSSPEALVRLSGRTASLRPIAGTRPRGLTPEHDAALETELLADPKENAEHVMLVDLARNDLGRVASLGLGARRSVPQDRALQPRDAHRERRAGAGRAGQGRVRSVRGRVPGRHARRRAEGARDAAHCRARAYCERPLRRHGRLLREERQHGSSDHDPHDGVRRRRVQLPGRRAASSRTACPRRNTRKCSRRARSCGGRSSSRRRVCERAASLDRQLRLVHLQPRAGVPRARGRGARLPQRRAHGRRCEKRSRRRTS